jgi:hypothetical protein
MRSDEKYFMIIVIIFVILLASKCMKTPDIDLKKFNRGVYGTH